MTIGQVITQIQDLLENFNQIWTLMLCGISSPHLRLSELTILGHFPTDVITWLATKKFFLNNHQACKINVCFPPRHVVCIFHFLRSEASIASILVVNWLKNFMIISGNYFHRIKTSASFCAINCKVFFLEKLVPWLVNLNFPAYQQLWYSIKLPMFKYKHTVKCNEI